MTDWTSVPPDRNPDPALTLEAKVNRLMINKLQSCLRFFSPEGVSDEAISIRAFEVVRETTRMEPDPPPGE